MKSFKQHLDERCWPGYKPVPGKKAYAKGSCTKEEVELTEGRPSQRHPLEGHEYHRKTNAELVHIAKDAHEAAEAMKSHNTTAENKYRDQANDSATVRYYRQKHGMQDWYKKKYGHVKEEVELDEVAKWRKSSAARIHPEHDPKDYMSSTSYDYYHDHPRSTGNLQATSDTEPKYHSLSTRPRAEVATKGPRKGMITKQHTQRLKDRIKSSLRNEEVELDEGLQQTLRKVVPGYAKKQINQKMDRAKFGKTDSDKDANYYRYKKIADKLNKEEVELDESEAWTRKEGQNPEGGLNRKGIASYRAANPGSKLSLAVTTKPSKLKPGSKAANRRKSFCSRMGGLKRKLTSSKTANDPNSRVNKALRKWNC